jgi:hypothetical protein
LNIHVKLPVACFDNMYTKSKAMQGNRLECHFSPESVDSAPLGSAARQKMGALSAAPELLRISGRA